MLTSLDPHSSYMNAKSFQEMQVQTQGKFGGLGIEVTMENGVVKVVAPIDDTPAARAGIMANDLIIKLDGEEVQGLTLNEAVDKMRGKINTPITLTMLREGKEPFDVKLIRDEIRVRSVKSSIEGQDKDIGYIRISSFTEQTQEGLDAAITSIKKDLGQQAQGLCHRSAQQSGRPARSGDLGVGQLPRSRRDRFDPRPQCRRDAALQCAARRSVGRQAGGRSDQWRLGVGLRDRCRRACRITSGRR